MGNLGAPMCDSGSLGKGVVDFSGGMGIGMKRGYSCILLTQENAAM